MISNGKENNIPLQRMAPTRDLPVIERELYMTCEPHPWQAPLPWLMLRNIPRDMLTSAPYISVSDAMSDIVNDEKLTT